MESAPPAEPCSTVPCPEPDPQPLLSKNERKRLLKAERYAANKAKRKAREKEQRRELAEKRRAGEPDDGEGRWSKRRRLEPVKLGPKNVFQARIVVDLAFDNLMSAREVVSLCSQLTYTYSSNRRSHTPFKLLICTSLNGKTLARLNTLGDQHKKWQHVEFWDEGYERLWNGQGGESDSTQACTQESVVYLTGDADEEIHELKEGETYIIGGICDYNRYKNLCFNKAKEQSIRSARLPIETYLAKLPTRKILTVNQVFDILLHWVEERDWAKALQAVMPKRKFKQGKGKRSGDGSSVKQEEGEGDAHEEEGEGDAHEEEGEGDAHEEEGEGDAHEEGEGDAHEEVVGDVDLDDPKTFKRE